MRHFINSNLDALIVPESMDESAVIKLYPNHYPIPTITSGFDTEMLSQMSLYDYAKLRYDVENDKTIQWPVESKKWSFAGKMWHLAQIRFNLVESLEYYLTSVPADIRKYSFFELGYLYDQNHRGLVVKKPFYIDRDDIINQVPEKIMRFKTTLYEGGYIVKTLN